MELLHVLYLSLGSIAVLFIISKMIGNREISQLSLFDYINGITIGSIAAEMATDLEEFQKPLIAMIVYGVAVAFISYITCKSIKLRRFFTGKPIILYEDGKLYGKNLAQAKLDINEFLTQCRNNGFFDLSHLHTAILETNGRLSFLPMAMQRPVTPQDLQLFPSQDKLVSNVIIDGHIMKDNLKHTGNNEAWLDVQLRAQGVSNISEVFLATCDCDNKFTVYTKINDKMKKDIFE